MLQYLCASACSHQTSSTKPKVRNATVAVQLTMGRGTVRISSVHGGACPTTIPMYAGGLSTREVHCMPLHLGNGAVRKHAQQVSAVYAGGLSEREVQCMHSSSGVVQDSSCIAPAPASSVSCNAPPCSFCADNVCSGQGTCIQDACQCSLGYTGMYCEVRCCQIKLYRPHMLLTIRCI